MNIKCFSFFGSEFQTSIEGHIIQLQYNERKRNGMWELMYSKSQFQEEAKTSWANA